MTTILPPQFGSRQTKFLALLLGLVIQLPAAANTGTFVDRQLPTDLRVVSYNVLWNTIFPSENPTQAAKFDRVVAALDPDILNLQEIGPNDPTAADVVALMNTIQPLPGGATWHGHQSWDNVIVSKYPLTMLATDTVPEPSSTSVAMALVDLPDAQFNTDFYFMNTHFKCCGGAGSTEDDKRQEQADALVNWMRDARTPGGNVNLPANTPMAITGDLNIVGSFQPINTLVTGNIINEGTYGSDSPPDWDGTGLTDAHPVHNATGATDYTWRNDGSGFAPGRLDYIIYTDSSLNVGNQFVLNTVAMNSAERTATGLQQYDVTQDSAGTNFDHLPVVVDFQMQTVTFAESDFNSSGTVDAADLTIWQTGFGITSGAAKTDGDANENGTVDGDDFLVWQRQSSAAAPIAAAIPEPTSLVLLMLGSLFMRRRAG